MKRRFGDAAVNDSAADELGPAEVPAGQDAIFNAAFDYNAEAHRLVACYVRIVGGGPEVKIPTYER